MRLYLFLCHAILSWSGRWLVGPERWSETQKIPRVFLTFPDPRPGERRVWFHAASVGELESVWPLVELASREENVRIVVTVFSSSAWTHVHKMARKLEATSALHVGYSPLEGGWRAAIAAARPALFVTAKYEAWPEMWDSLARYKTPLAIIGAKPRSSLLWAQRILGALRGKIPYLYFFSFDAENEPGLIRRFPGSVVIPESDPRWDRVFQRRQDPHPRVRALDREFLGLPRPWGIIGSAWAADLAFLPPEAASTISGTLWVVPHKITPRSLSELEILLRDRGYTPIRTSVSERIPRAGRIALLVDEMGFLAELYSTMDWAFIGGGFGGNIHSTIEPAIYGLPICAGPRGQAKFDEIPLLQKQSQLRIFDEGKVPAGMIDNFQAWFDRELGGDPVALRTRRDEWIGLNLRHRGASDRIWARLFYLLGRA